MVAYVKVFVSSEQYIGEKMSVHGKECKEKSQWDLVTEYADKVAAKSQEISQLL